MGSNGSHLPFAPLTDWELTPQANGAELTRAYCDHAGGRKPLRGWLTLVRSRPISHVVCPLHVDVDGEQPWTDLTRAAESGQGQWTECSQLLARSN